FKRPQKVTLWVGMYQTIDSQHWLYAAPTEKALYEKVFSEAIEGWVWDELLKGKKPPKDRKTAVHKYFTAVEKAGGHVYMDADEVEMKL
ncbi:unnamed protein product, partial [marine sediment metagenome]